MAFIASQLQPKHVFDVIFTFAKAQSRSCGDNTYDDNMVEFENISQMPIVEYFDEDFHYVETAFLKYLIEH